MTRDEAEAAVPRLRAALAEVGYGDIELRVQPFDDGDWDIVKPRRAATLEAWWTALLITGIAVRCWDCYQPDSVHTGERKPICTHDLWASRPRLERVS